MKLRKLTSILFFLYYIVSPNTFGQLNIVSNQNIDFSSAVTTLKSGNWTDTSIWSNNQVPNADTDVIINNQHNVYIDKQGATSGQIVDLCKNIYIKQFAVLQMGHDASGFAKDLRINGSILCNGTFSAGRNKPSGTGDGLIYSFNSRVFLNLIENDTYISGSGFFNPRSLNISSDLENRELIIDIYNLMTDDSFAIKSSKRVNVTISHFSYVRIKKILGITGSDFQFSSPTAKADLTINGIVVADDVSLFTKNTASGESSSITIENKGSLYTQKINKGILDRKAAAAGFNLTIKAGGLFRLGQNIDFNNLISSNSNFVFTNSGDLRKHYSETLSTTSQITSGISEFDPNLGKDVSQIVDVFGATHIAGWYNFTDRPFMLEGLDKYKEFGASSIKTTLTSTNGSMQNAYPFNHNFPNFQNLKEVAQHQFIDSLFKRSHIKTHTFWTVTKNQSMYKEGPDFNHEKFLDVEQQFYDLTKHLLETYGNMDKKFIYQNWEGDWMLRGQGVLWEKDPSLIPDNVDWTIEGMARMFRARQRGTERARNEYANVTAKVFHGIEFNKLWWIDSGVRKTMMDSNTPSVTGNVLPLVRLDITSWSAYDGGWTNASNPDGHAMWKGLEIARYFTTETNDLPFSFPVQIGEFAINENPPYNGNNTETVIKNRYGKYIGVALGLGLPNFYLWNLYSSGQQNGPDGFTWEKNVQYDTDFLYQWMDGKWLLEPDGSWGTAATFLMDIWKSTLSTNNFLLDNNKELLVFPNPASNFIRINGIDEACKLTFFDLNGKKLKEINYNNNGVDVSELNKGIYLILIKSNTNNIITKKLIIN